MFKFALLTTVLLSLSAEIKTINANENAPNESAYSSQTPVPFADSFTGSDSHLKAPQRLRITEEVTWTNVWLQHRNIRDIRGRSPVPQIDFNRFMVIGLVEEADLFPNGIKIAQIESVGSNTREKVRGVQFVTIDFESPGKTEQLESGAERNVFGFFVIPRDNRQLILRRKTQDGSQEVKRFPALPLGAGIVLSDDPNRSASPITVTVIAKTPPGNKLPSLSDNGLHPNGKTNPAERTRINPTHSGAINIGFAFDPGQGQYDGVVGAPSDVWNFVDIGTTAIDYMRHPNASSSTARLRITQHDGEWAVKTDNQIFRGYIYHNCQCVDLEATLLDVAPGRYRAYVYAHGDAPNQNAKIEVLVGERSVGMKTTAKGDSSEFQSSELKKGVHYVTFEFEVAAADTIRIISHRDGSGYSMLNAIQLVPIQGDSSNSKQSTELNPKKQKQLYQEFTAARETDDRERTAHILAEHWQSNGLRKNIKDGLVDRHYRFELRQVYGENQSPNFVVRCSQTFPFPDVWTHFTPTLYINGEAVWAPKKPQTSHAMSVNNSVVTSRVGGSLKNGDVVQYQIEMLHEVDNETVWKRTLWTNQIVVQDLKE